MTSDIEAAAPHTGRATAQSDPELVLRTRSGDASAYAELWRRHYGSGVTAARAVTGSFDPDDLVQESFAQIYQTIRKGGGPTGSFRAYLVTSIRNTAARWGNARKEAATDDLEWIADPDSTDQSAERALDRSLSAQAFRSLPERWQEVLWYSEVEQLKAAEIAPLLGMTANATSQLAFRAREGLREAWVQAHLNTAGAGSDCAWTLAHLAGHARETLSRRDRRKVDDHLGICGRCLIVAAEAKDAANRLALVLLPLALGATGAVAYTALLQAGSAQAAVFVPMPAGVTATAAAHGALGAAAGPGAAGAAGAAGASGTGSTSAAAGTAAAGGAGASGAVPLGGMLAIVGAGAASLVIAGAVVTAASWTTAASNPVSDADTAPADTGPAPVAAAIAPAPVAAPPVSPVPEPAPAPAPPVAETDPSPPPAVTPVADPPTPVTAVVTPVVSAAPVAPAPPVPVPPTPVPPAPPTPVPPAPAPLTLSSFTVICEERGWQIALVTTFTGTPDTAVHGEISPVRGNSTGSTAGDAALNADGAGSLTLRPRPGQLMSGAQLRISYLTTATIDVSLVVDVLAGAGKQAWEDCLAGQSGATAPPDAAAPSDPSSPGAPSTPSVPPASPDAGSPPPPADPAPQPTEPLPDRGPATLPTRETSAAMDPIDGDAPTSIATPEAPSATDAAP